jgi:hypothetical protein
MQSLVVVAMQSLVVVAMLVVTCAILVFWDATLLA